MHLPILALHFHRKLCKLSHTFLQQLYKCHRVQGQDWLIHQLKVTDGSSSYQGSHLKRRQTLRVVFFSLFLLLLFCWIFIFLFVFVSDFYQSEANIQSYHLAVAKHTMLTKANEGFARKTGIVNQTP